MVQFPKKAIIIGSSSGIGRALALKLSEEGYFLGLAGRKIAEMEKLKEDCKLNAIVQFLDLTCPDQALENFKMLLANLGDEDYRPVLVPGEEGNLPLVISGDFEVGRPPGVIQGSSLDIPFAFNLGPITLLPGKRYVWKLSIDGKSEDIWQATFSTKSQETPSIS